MSSTASGPIGHSTPPTLPGGTFRDLHADWLKAAAIVGVVCIHAGVSHNAIFRFCVPVFVGLWAFYVEKALARRTSDMQWRYVRARLLELGIPYLAWTLVYIWVSHAENWSVTSMRTVVNGWFGGYGWAGQYYLIMLFQLLVLVPFLRRLITPKSAMPIIVVGAIFNIACGRWWFSNYWVTVGGDRLFIYWIPYVALGIALAHGMFNGKPALLLAASAALLFGAAFEPNISYLSVTITLASLLLLLAAALADRTAHRIPDWFLPIAATAAALGQRTFPVFVANPLMIEVLQRVGFASFAHNAFGVLGPLLVAVLAIACSLVLGEVLERLGLGALVGSKKAVPRSAPAPQSTH